MKFREFLTLTENDNRTGSKLGLYPDLYDVLGQYPPLYCTPGAADFITYYDMNFRAKSRKPGIIDPKSLMHNEKPTTIKPFKG
jgi:hypothetical protein